ncbi:benzoate 4-monooxygenase cytochrome P450 [Nemania sp. NC0429]|nr:benzoate 4-monooxygenase cytochrome P450 [Nemania sp. NC0429]
MPEFSPNQTATGLMNGLTILFTILALGLFSKVIYNLFFHPLAGVPGPLLARISSVPSWYHATRGDHHIWLTKQFQIYGERIRPEPNTVLFRDSQAYAEIYGAKSNVRRSRFYEAFTRNSREHTVMTLIDVAEHARRRKQLNLGFTEKSIRASSDFIVKHVDRWIQIIADETITEWSPPMDFTQKIDALMFDMMADLCFGRSFEIKKPGDNPLKSIPHNISEYMKFYYSLCRFPFLGALLWLKPRGLDTLLAMMAPPAVVEFNQFVADSVTNRIALQEAEAAKPEAERRQDMFYFLAEARDPDTGSLAYDESTLRAESNLLLIAASDTTAISLAGILFYLTGHPARCEKLAKEIRSTFSSVSEIVYGPKLSACRYLRACIDEGMRLTPTGPSELPREVLPGGLRIKGQYYPAGTIVGTAAWAMSRNAQIYGDAETYRPERWISCDEDPDGVTEEALKRAKAGFHPFLSGPGNCVGQGLAMTAMCLTIARMLYQLDIGRVPGSSLGGGGDHGLGWGQDDPHHIQLGDAYTALRRGPGVQFRKRRIK